MRASDACTARSRSALDALSHSVSVSITMHEIYVTLSYTPRIETPLTPLEFMRRARRLYASREAVVDGALRYTYADFFDRCDRWAAYLRSLGVNRGDRVVYIAPNTH